MQGDDVKDVKDYVDREIKAVRDIMAENDRRYAAQSEASKAAVALALNAQKDLTTSRFDASEKAILKAEQAQTTYNQTHNELSRKMDEQYKSMMPRPEADARFQMLDQKIAETKEASNAKRLEFLKEIQNLRESRSVGEGEKGGKLSMRETIAWLAGLVSFGLLLWSHAAK